MENEILLKIEKIKDIFLNKIKSFDDYQYNKYIIKEGLEEIESLLIELLNLRDDTITDNYEKISNEKFPDEKEQTIEVKKELNLNEEKDKNISKINNNDEKHSTGILQNSENESLLKIANDIIVQENYNYPKLNYNYDKNFYDILNENNKPIFNNNLINTKNNENTSTHYPIKNKSNDQTKNNNFQSSRYSNLFNFDPENNNNSCSNIINKSSFINEDSYFKKDNNESINTKNNNNSKALRVADIIMKINSNDILYDIIVQLYSKDIFDQLMSPNVDINLINCLEEAINKINILEKEETQKIKNKGKNLSNNKNSVDISSSNNKNNNYKTNNNHLSISISENINNSELPQKNSIKQKLNKKEFERFNSEILKRYPKTVKTLLGYEKCKKDRSNYIHDFDFESFMKNENYLKDKKLNTYSNYTSKSNKSFSKQKKFNPYGTIYGDYFDRSLQRGGESKFKLSCPTVSNRNKMFKYCRSPVKDYIEGISGLNDIYI